MEDATTIRSFNALPTDILHRIFMDVGSNVRDKIRLSHVCKRWRTTALSFPLMWTNLDLNYLSIHTVGMVMQRSQGLPLSLHCSVWSALRHNVCMTELRRTREIDFSIDSYSQSTLRPFLENTPAPFLVRCRLEYTSYEVQAPPIFGKQHALLQDLTLINCRMAYAAGNYSGLRRLELRCTLEPDLTYPGDECLIEVFKGCPDLEEVILHGCAVHPELTKAYVGHGHDIVLLPKLRSMDLRLRTSNVHAITSSVQPALDVKLKISAYTCPNAPEQDQVLSDHSPLMAVALGRARGLVLDGVTSSLHAFTDATLKSEHTRIHLDYNHPHDVFGLLLKPIISSQMMLQLERLRLRQIADADVVTLLRSLPVLTTLDLAFEESNGAQAFNILSSVEAEARAGLCPELSSITLDGAFVDMVTRTALIQLRAVFPKLRHLALHRCKLEVPVEMALDALKDFGQVDWFSDQLPSFI